MCPGDRALRQRRGRGPVLPASSAQTFQSGVNSHQCPGGPSPSTDGQRRTLLISQVLGKEGGALASQPLHLTCTGPSLTPPTHPAPMPLPAGTDEPRRTQANHSLPTPTSEGSNSAEGAGRPSWGHQSPPSSHSNHPLTHPVACMPRAWGRMRKPPGRKKEAAGGEGAHHVLAQLCPCLNVWPIWHQLHARAQEERVLNDWGLGLPGRTPRPMVSKQENCLPYITGLTFPGASAFPTQEERIQMRAEVSRPPT